MTWEERAFIYRAWENKKVTETQLINNAMLNAMENIFGGMFIKNYKHVSMWNEEATEQKIDKKEMESLMAKVIKMEEEQGKDWLKKMRR